MSIPSLSLEGQVAIVTGGGTGIGRAIALAFAKAGADVVVASRRLSVLEKVSEEITALGKGSLAVQTDISRKTDVDNLVQRVMDEFGVIDILVNNAAVWFKRRILEFCEDDWDKIMDVNLKGYYLCSQAVGKRMVQQKRGNIINIASVSSFEVNEGEGPYCISKAGVAMLTRALAKELARYNIRVNAIAPGYVRTPMGDLDWNDPVALKEHLPKIEASIPMGWTAEPSDIGSVAVFFASDASRYITGDITLVDGGYIA